ncbi:MAG: hypothetical protein UH678_04255 [Fibrobacteraceae bacterium]|nr:hypothetical protein [Fibrobacteraceae bacterium]
MIHLNLIEAAERTVSSAVVQPLHVSAPNKQEGQQKKKWMTVVVAAATLVVVSFSAMVVFGVPKPLQSVMPVAMLEFLGVEPESDIAIDSASRITKAGGSIAAQRAQEEAAARARANVSVSSLVSEVQPTMFEKQKRKDYQEYLPLEKQQYQKAAYGQFMAFIQTATPEDIGFTDLVFEAPNFYYVRGVADAPLAQRSFLERLRTVSVDFRTPPIPENAPATDITAFGSIKLENVNVSVPVNSFIASDSVDSELRQLKTLDASGKMKISGLAKPKTEDFGTYKHLIYNMKAVGDFSQVHAFVQAWKGSPLRVGIRRAVLERQGKDISATFVLDVFAKP